MHPALSALIALAGLAGTALASPPPQVPVATDAACTDARFAVYFETGSGALPRGTDAALTALDATLEGCAIAAIEMRTAAILADGTPGDALAEARSDAVRGALAARGLAVPEARFRATRIAYAAADDEAQLPLARRVDVRIRAVAPGMVG